MRRLTEEARQKGILAAREARKKAPSRREKMARYAQTFARQRAEYQATAAKGMEPGPRLARLALQGGLQGGGEGMAVIPMRCLAL
jgi:hypothetical protein